LKLNPSNLKSRPAAVDRRWCLQDKPEFSDDRDQDCFANIPGFLPRYRRRTNESTGYRHDHALRRGAVRSQLFRAESNE
jgi:hypothetical protein